jgi:hypothetical protein
MINEEMSWKVEIEGLPPMYVNGRSAGAVKNALRPILKNPGSDIISIKRVTSTQIKKDFRLRLTDKNDLEGEIVKSDDVKEAKDSNEYDNEGEMAKTKLRGVLSDAQALIDMFEDEDNLPEWVQSKIIKASDYLNSAARYIKNKDDVQEQKDEEMSIDEGRFNPKQVKMAIGIASDKRFAKGNMTGAVKAIDKIAKGLSNHPQVAAVLRRQNEESEPLIDPKRKKETKGDEQGIDNETALGRKMQIQNKIIDEGAEVYIMKKGPYKRRVDGATADRMKRQGWTLLARDRVREDVTEAARLPKGYGDEDLVHIAKAKVGSFYNPQTDKIVGYSKAPKNPNRFPKPKAGANAVMRIGDAKKKRFKIEDFREEVEQIDEALPPHLAKLFDKEGNFKDKRKQQVFNKMMGDGIGKEIAKDMGRIKYTVDADEKKKKVFVKVDRNDAVDAAKALKKHPAYASGAMKVVFKEEIESLIEMSEEFIVEFSPAQLDKMRKEYGKLKTINPTTPAYKKLKAFLDGLDKDKLMKLAGGKIDFVSDMAATTLRYKHKVPFSKSQPREGVAEGSCNTITASTKAYAASLEKIANDKKLRNISKQDRETLAKLADLMKSEALGPEDEEKVKEIIGKLKGASKSHADQAATLQKAVSEADTLGLAIADKKKYKANDKKLAEMTPAQRAKRDAQRAMGRGPKVDPADVDDAKADKNDEKSAKKNIIVQLRKAGDTKGAVPVEFENGRKQKVPTNIIQIALQKHDSFRKPATKQKLVKAMSKSYRDMLMALKTIKEDKSTLNVAKAVIEQLEKLDD